MISNAEPGGCPFLARLLPAMLRSGKVMQPVLFNLVQGRTGGGESIFWALIHEQNSENCVFFPRSPLHYTTILSKCSLKNSHTCLKTPKVRLLHLIGDSTIKEWKEISFCHLKKVLKIIFLSKDRESGLILLSIITWEFHVVLYLQMSKLVCILGKRVWGPSARSLRGFYFCLCFRLGISQREVPNFLIHGSHPRSLHLCEFIL